VQLTREEKERFLRGTGGQEGEWERLPGYYIGDAGIDERLGVPPLNLADGGQGFRIEKKTKEALAEVTSWPTTLAVAATWNDELVERWAAAVAKEFSMKGANVLLGPGLNVHRIARGGRNAEYISGESPYLGQRLAPAFVRGVQSQNVLAVMKHFIGNSQETNRFDSNSIINRRTLWEVYYPPFVAAVDAGVAAAMCSYNFVNGKQACDNPDILLSDLKGRMGFEGWVMSDWWALRNFSAHAGCDQEMPGTANPGQEAQFSDKKLATLADSKVDNMVGRMLRMMMRNGLFDRPHCTPPHCDKQLYEVQASSPEHKALSRELATKSVVLLKNRGQILPLGPSIKRIALLGSACDAAHDLHHLFSSWDQGDYYVLGGSGRVVGVDAVSIRAGLHSHCSTRGCEVIVSVTDDVSLAMEAASGADVAILCSGATTTEGKDRDSLSVDQQSFMVLASRAISIPIVSLTIAPGSVLMPWANDVEVVLLIFLAGDYTGLAFADVLFGVTNPAAKLPVTIPKFESDTIAPCKESDCHYPEGLHAGFPAFEGKDVTFPFGHGLSYSSFDYKLLALTNRTSAGVTGTPSICDDAVMCITVRITNTGSFSGGEVPQLYMGFPRGIGEPPKVLRGLVATKPMEPSFSEDVTFPLRRQDLQIFSEASDQWIFTDGRFDLYIGSSSRDVRLNSAFAMCNGFASLDVGRDCISSSIQDFKQ